MTEEQRETLDDSLAMRVRSGAMVKFKQRCSLINRPYQDMLRELIEAFGDGRVSIQLTEQQKLAIEETYRGN